VSDIIRKGAESHKKAWQLSQAEYDYLRDLDTVQRSTNYYHQRLITQFLKNKSIAFGYNPEANLEFKVDLTGGDMTLTIKEVPLPPEGLPYEPPMHKVG
jgi:hypothetical protein